MRGSSVNFKKIKSAIHAVSHASRAAPPDYLLPADLSLGTFVVLDDMGEVQKTLTHKMALASGRAKATEGYSPLWEGVINLPDPANATAKQQIAIIEKWCVEYEMLTGHKVLRADVHLDEGYVDEAGKANFNAHAHVMADRTNDKGRVIKLSPGQLRAVQTMTAEVTGLDRGIDARQTRRKHVGHQNFRFDAEKNRTALDKEKEKTALEGKLTDILRQTLLDTKIQLKKTQHEADLVPGLVDEIARIKEQYRMDREAMKASGTATQADYQRVKKTLETKLAIIEAELQETKKALKISNEKVETMEKALKLATAKDHVMVKELADLRKTKPKALASTEILKAVDRILIDQAAERLEKEAQEAPNAPALPIPSPTLAKQPEEVFPRLTEDEFEDLDYREFAAMEPKINLKMRSVWVAAAKDVLVRSVDLTEAAIKHNLPVTRIMQMLKKLISHYIAPEPVKPAPTLAPAQVKITGKSKLGNER